MGDPVLAIVGLVAGTTAIAGGFVAEAPNRLVNGAPLSLWGAAGPTIAILIGLSIASLLALSFRVSTRSTAGATAFVAAALLLLLLYGAGDAASSLTDAAKPAARTSLGAGFWIMSLCAGLAAIDGVQRLKPRPLALCLITLAIVCAVAALGFSGGLDDLSIAREYQARRTLFADAIGRHCALVLAALLITLALGLPLGFLAARRKRLKLPLFTILNLLQTVPSVALFGLLITPLSALAALSPALASLGIQGIGVAPALIALCLYSLLPIVRNAETAIAGADRAVIDAALGMGFTRRQIFWRVELPLGLPVLLAGVRIVLVQTIGLAVVAALIGAGGLGTFIFQGIGQYAVDLVLLGALPTIGLALAADFLLRQIVALLRDGRAA
jgi:osmoprotectant transport system permease protein